LDPAAALDRASADSLTIRGSTAAALNTPATTLALCSQKSHHFVVDGNSSLLPLLFATLYPRPYFFFSSIVRQMRSVFFLNVLIDPLRSQNLINALSE
jgi:hypothetical protein